MSMRTSKIIQKIENDLAGIIDKGSVTLRYRDNQNKYLSLGCEINGTKWRILTHDDNGKLFSFEMEFKYITYTAILNEIRKSFDFRNED